MANYYNFFSNHPCVDYNEIAEWLEAKKMEQQNQQKKYFIDISDSSSPLIQQTYYPYPSLPTDALKELIDDVCYSKAYGFNCEFDGPPMAIYDNVKEKYSETLDFEKKINFYENKLKEVKNLLKEYYNYDKSFKNSSNFYEKKASEKLIRRVEEIAKILNIKLDEE